MLPVRRGDDVPQHCAFLPDQDGSLGMHGFAQALATADSVDAAMDILHGTVVRLGFPLVDYSYMPVPRLRTGEWRAPPLMTRNFPRGWDREWNKHRRHDPYFHACFEGRRFVDWSVIQRRTNLDSRERDCLNYLADQGICRGLTVPIHLAGGRFAFVTVAGDSPEEEWQLRASRWCEAIFLLAHYFHHIVLSKFDTPFNTGGCAPLSPREAECLHWAAQGKTTEETAIILGLSLETVRIHLKRATVKLDAANRSHAVAKALSLGYIDPVA